MLLLLCFSLPIDLAKAQRQKTSWIGNLSCRVSGGGSFILGSTRRLACVYKSSNGRSTRYAGRIQRFGVDIGPVKSAVMGWQIFVPISNKKTPGRLTGTYVGHGAQAAVGVGLGYNALYGLNNVMLNPYSVTGVSGVNAAAGISSLRLDYVGR